ncbi:unnamed protein product [Heligmosomoides polygyrus]|uniref:Uncharacterized protein n=1 Tax=Heligmosomoides polygyrus TaxID=6339 RepID=A0A183G7A3_HELPZ|nr:unnamed protein product [Heligmosomoides polygyrus]
MQGRLARSSRNLAPKQHLRDRCFNGRSGLESKVAHFFESQPTSFWMKGIRDLPIRSKMVVDVPPSMNAAAQPQRKVSSMVPLDVAIGSPPFEPPPSLQQASSLEQNHLP